MAIAERRSSRGKALKSRGRASWGHALRLSEEESRWREILPLLPENVGRIWDAVEEVRHLRRVLHHYGGRNIRIPRVLPKERTHSLRRTLGLRCLQKLMAMFGGTCLYVPRCEALLERMRQREIIETFSRNTGHGVSSTAAVANLARAHGISDRRIWQILKKEASTPSQARVLYGLADSASVGIAPDEIP